MCCDLVIGVAIKATIIITAPIQPIIVGMLMSENKPGAQLPSMAY